MAACAAMTTSDAMSIEIARCSLFVIYWKTANSRSVMAAQAAIHGNGAGGRLREAVEPAPIKIYLKCFESFSPCP
jgi:hypothetical protein